MGYIKYFLLFILPIQCYAELNLDINVGAVINKRGAGSNYYCENGCTVKSFETPVLDLNIMYKKENYNIKYTHISSIFDNTDRPIDMISFGFSYTLK